MTQDSYSVPNRVKVMGHRASPNTVYSGYSGHVYSGYSDIVATFPGTKYFYSIMFRSDIVASRIKWPERCGPRWPLYSKCTVIQFQYILTIARLRI